MLPPQIFTYGREWPSLAYEPCRALTLRCAPHLVFKPPSPVGAGGGYMFLGRPSVIHVVVLCFRDISSICWRIFAKLLSLVYFGTEMTWLRFWVKRAKFKVMPSRRRRTALFLVLFSVRSLRSLGQLPRNFATWLEMGAILKTRSKNWGSPQKKFGAEKRAEPFYWYFIIKVQMLSMLDNICRCQMNCHICLLLFCWSTD